MKDRDPGPITNLVSRAPKLYSFATYEGWSPLATGIKVISIMQLLQIGVPQQKTVLDLIMELSERQWQELEQLKRSARDRADRKRTRVKQRAQHAQ